MFDVDPEAFQVEYEEMRTLQGAIEDDWQFLNRVWQAVEDERKQDKPKYAPICREFLPKIRQIYWGRDPHDWVAKRARVILDELMLEQTMPLAELDLPYEADSYTGEKTIAPALQGADARKLVRVASKVEDQWAKDFAEVQAEVAMIADPDSVLPLLDEDTYDGVRALFGNVKPVENLKKVILRHDDSLAARIAQEYDGDERGLAAAASMYDISGDDEDIWFEEGDIPSVPLKQAEEQELKVDIMELVETRNAAKPYLDAIRQRRSAWFDWMNNTGEHELRSQLKASLGKRRLGKDDWKTRMQYERWRSFRQMINGSTERTDFLEFLQKQADAGVSPQVLCTIFLSIQDDRWALHIEDAEAITLPDDGEIMPLGTSNWRYEATVDLSIRHTLADFIEMFGDAILDEALDPIGRGYPTSEAQIRVLAEAWQEQVIQEQFQEEAHTMEEIVHTRHYARGVFQAEGDDLHEAGMIAFRWGQSRVGAIAYQKAIDAGKSIKQAWRAFWNAGTITSLNISGVKVVSPANGKVQFCDWGLAAWKIANGEIYLTKDDALRLKGILSANRWGTDLISQL